jgi:hypothetical protein
MILTAVVYETASAKNGEEQLTRSSGTSLKSGTMQPGWVLKTNGYIESGGVQGDNHTQKLAQPAIWYGLAVSLSGALTLWLSVIMLARQEAY